MFDTHCHLNFEAFKDDYINVIQDSLERGMFLTIVGSQYETSKRGVEIAHEFKEDPVYAAVGLHPTHVGKSDELHTWEYDKYKKLAQQKKVVALGETGIDLYRSADTLKKQRQVFKEHMCLASELNKPLIIHCRPSKNSFDAYEELLKLLTTAPHSREESTQSIEENKKKPESLKGVLHCYLGNKKLTEKFLALGLYISFTGIITFKNVDAHLIEAVKKIPLERMMIETDAPYLTPEPFRGRERCEPRHVEYIAQKIAEIKGIGTDEVLRVTTSNGKRLFLR